MKLYQYISYIFIILIYFKCNVTYVSIIFKAKFAVNLKSPREATFILVLNLALPRRLLFAILAV